MEFHSKARSNALVSFCPVELACVPRSSTCRYCRGRRALSATAYIRCEKCLHLVGKVGLSLPASAVKVLPVPGGPLKSTMSPWPRYSYVK